MRKMFAIAALCVIGLFVGCDSESSTAAGGQPGSASTDPTGLVGTWRKTLKNGYVKASNTVYIFFADGRFLNTQTPPLTEKSYFYRDSGSWITLHDTIKFISSGFTTSFDSGKTWKSEPPDTFYLPYRISGAQLIIIGKDLDDGSDVLNYFVKE